MSNPTDERSHQDRLKLARAFDELCRLKSTRQLDPVIPYHQDFASAFEWFCRGALYARTNSSKAQASDGSHDPRA